MDDSKKAELLAEAKKRFKESADAWDEIRKSALEDVKFINGDQWEPEVKQKREEDGRPCLTINKLESFINQVIGDVRQNRPSISVVPAEDGDDDGAEIRSGLIRAIERNSQAEVAYDTAFEDACSGGFGFFRIDVDYINDDNFYQDIQINPIHNQFSVYTDLNGSTRFDMSDGMFAFVSDKLTRRQIEKNYPKAKNITDWELDGEGDRSDWKDGDSYRVCEYWYKEPVEREIVLLTDGSVVDAADIEKSDELRTRIAEQGIGVVDTRTVKSHKVMQCVLMGGGLLTDPVEWSGRHIPIVCVPGRYDIMDGKKVFKSLIRHAKDVQRMYNYWRSMATEAVALAPKSPWLATPEQIEGHEEDWSRAHTDNIPVLQYNNTGDPIPARQPMAQIPAAVLTESRETSDEMKAVVGIYDASLGNRSNETSGIAIRARQSQSDIGTFEFVDNLTRAIEYAGRIIVDLIPHVYTQQRTVRILGEDGKAEFVEANKPVVAEDGVSVVKMFDLAAGKYDVVVKTGPQYATQRQEMAQSIIQLMQSMPDAAPLLADLAVKAMDFPDSEDVVKRLKTLLPPELKAEDGEESAEVQAVKMQAEQMMEQMTQAFEQMQAELAQAKEDADTEQEKLAIESAVKMQELQIKQFEAETARLKVRMDAEDADGKIAMEAMREQTKQMQAEVDRMKQGLSDAIV